MIVIRNTYSTEERLLIWGIEVTILPLFSCSYKATFLSEPAATLQYFTLNCGSEEMLLSFKIPGETG